PYPHDAAHQVDREVAAAEDRLLALLLQAMAERGADAGEQFRRAERLRHKIVGAQIERFHLVFFVRAAGQYQDRQSVVASPQRPDHLQAAYIGQAEIENDQIGAGSLDFSERAAPIRRFGHLEPLRAQAGAQKPADRRLVIDDEDGCRVRAHGLASSLPASGTGRVTVKTPPCPPGRLAASTVPAIASTKPRQMARPRP